MELSHFHRRIVVRDRHYSEREDRYHHRDDRRDDYYHNTRNYYEPPPRNSSDRHNYDLSRDYQYPSRYVPPAQPPRQPSRSDGLIERYEGRGDGHRKKKQASHAAELETKKTATAHADYTKQKSHHVASASAKSGKRVIVALRSSSVQSEDTVDRQSEEGLFILKCCASRVLGTTNYNATVAYRNGERSSNGISDRNELWDEIKTVPDNSELTIFVISLVGLTTSIQQLKQVVERVKARGITVKIYFHERTSDFYNDDKYKQFCKQYMTKLASGRLGIGFHINVSSLLSGNLSDPQLTELFDLWGRIDQQKLLRNKELYPSGRMTLTDKEKRAMAQEAGI